MKKILVIHSWGIGDLILATPMFQSLYLSGYQIDLVIFSTINKTVLKNNDFINKIFYIDKKYQLLQFMFKYDYLVATAGTNPKKIYFLNKFIRAKRVFSSNQKRDIHRIEMNLKIVEELINTKIIEPYIYLNQNNSILDKYIKKGKKNIGFAVGSGSKQIFKRWDKYKELISKIDGNKLLFIGPDEKDLEKEYLNLDLKIVKESLEDTIKIISNLDLLIGNDNGLMHIGYATKINTISIFGMTNEKETGGYRKNNENVFLNIDCRPCFNPTTDYVGCNTFDCLKNLEVNKVLEKCQKYL